MKVSVSSLFPSALVLLPLTEPSMWAGCSLGAGNEGTSRGAAGRWGTTVTLLRHGSGSTSGCEPQLKNQLLGKEEDSSLGRLSRPVRGEPPLKVFSRAFTNSSLQGQAPAPLSKLAQSPGRQIPRSRAACSAV